MLTTLFGPRARRAPKLAPRSFADVPDTALAFALHHRDPHIDAVPSPVIFTFTDMTTTKGTAKLTRIVGGEGETFAQLDEAAQRTFADRAEGDWQALVWEGVLVADGARRDAFCVRARDNRSGKTADVIRPFTLEGAKAWSGPTQTL